MIRKKLAFFVILTIIFSCNRQEKQYLKDCCENQKRSYSSSQLITPPLTVQKIYDLIYEYRDIDYKKSEDLIRDLLVISEEINFPHGKAKACYSQAHLFVVHKQDYQNALDFYEKALCIYETIGDKQGMAECYTAIGSAYYSNSLYDAALVSYNKALAWWRLIANEVQEANTLRGLGLVYQCQMNYELAVEKFLQSLKLCEGQGDKKGIAQLCNSLGMVYGDKGHFNQAIDYYNQSIIMNEAIGSQRGLANAFNNIGLIYKKQKNYELAMDYLIKSLDIEKQLKNDVGIVQSYSNIGSTEVLANRIEKGINWLKQAEVLAKDFGDKSILANIKEELSLAYEKLGNQEHAKLYKQESTDLYNAVQKEQTKLALRQERKQLGLQIYALEYIHAEEEKSRLDSIYQKKKREEERLMYPSYK